MMIKMMMMGIPTLIAGSYATSRVPHPSSSPQCFLKRRVVSVAKSQFSDPRRHRRSIGNKDRKLNFSWAATVGEKVQTTMPVVPTSVPVSVAKELHQAGHHYLDVRTPEEFGAGHAPGAINVPYMYRLGSGMMKNANFVEEVLTHFRKDDEIIVGCQFGKRSLMAATDLLSAGLTGVTDIAGGFAAWSQIGLPTKT